MTGEHAPADGHAPPTLGRHSASEAEIVAFLRDPGTYVPAPAAVDLIETHAARIFLAGAEAIKIKRRVCYTYLDFSTLAERRRALQRELEINRPNAPQIYRDLQPIVRDRAGHLRFGGDGMIVDWALRMHRFDEHSVLDRIADATPLASGVIDKLAGAVAEHHQRAPVAPSPIGAQSVSAIIDELATELDCFSVNVPSGRLADLIQRLHQEHDRVAPLLDLRAQEGFVRRCHGDLHLGNIVLLDGRPVLFDALEFDERLATIDTLYDLAFLVMDIDRRGQRPAANLLLNRYLTERGEDRDLDGLAALPLFLALRAAIRAMTELQKVAGSGQTAEDRSTALVYLERAIGYATPTEPRLIAVGGFSGTGKSTLARRLAPSIGNAPGALHLRSDVERKRMLGQAELKSLDPAGYTAEASRRVYERLRQKAERALAAGHSVVVDAVYAEPAERESVEAIAHAASVAFDGLWLTADPALLVARVTSRTGDASDADARIVTQQLRHGAGLIDWHIVDAAGSAAATLRGSCRAIDLPCDGDCRS
ncbi:MAG: AAA family ATPase [Hyphomicrobiaceae bacterium]